MKTRTGRLQALAATLLLIAAGCGDSGDDAADDQADAGDEHAGTGHDADAGMDGVDEEDAVTSKAADFRITLNLLLSEHLIVAAKATGAALGGRDDEYKAYGALLDQNGKDIGGAIGDIYGSKDEAEFNRIWSAHNGFFVDYTVGKAMKDKAMQDAAVQSLTNEYVPQFAKFLAEATGLAESALKPGITAHVLTTKAIVDAQADGKWSAAYTAIRQAFGHMQMLGDPLAEAITTKFADDFPGDCTAKSVDLRVTLNQKLQEHLYLASFATGAALGGRSDEFKAAGASLGDNGTDLGEAIGSLYGNAAKDQFNEVWSQHNGFFVDYTTGVAGGDKAAQDKAVESLTKTYVPKFAAFLAGATDLPEAQLASGTQAHVLTTKAIVDAQKVLVDGTSAAKAKAVVDADRAGGQHMQMLADALAPAIVKKLPDKF